MNTGKDESANLLSKITKRSYDLMYQENKIAKALWFISYFVGRVELSEVQTQESYTVLNMM